MQKSYFILNNDSETTSNLCEVFKDFPEFTCSGITGDYDEGMNLILKFSSDIVFINIDPKPGKSYNDVFSYCKDFNSYLQKNPLLVALSIDESKAYLTLKNKFFDYILKPGNELEIRKTILQEGVDLTLSE